MRTRMFYFSSTGNSLHAARRLAQAMSASAPESMVGAAFDGEADAVGLVFPAYLHKAPAIALEFARRSSFGSAYVFAVATNNGGPGSCLRGLAAALRSRLSRLAAGPALASVLGPTSSSRSVGPRGDGTASPASPATMPAPRAPSISRGIPRNACATGIPRSGSRNYSIGRAELVSAGG
jgi:hypothetical protein